MPILMNRKSAIEKKLRYSKPTQTKQAHILQGVTKQSGILTLAVL